MVKKVLTSKAFPLRPHERVAEHTSETCTIISAIAGSIDNTLGAPSPLGLFIVFPLIAPAYAYVYRRLEGSAVASEVEPTLVGPAAR